MRKQPVAWKEYCVESTGLKEFQENMDRCTGRRDLTGILIKTALNTIQSIDQSLNLGQSQNNVYGEWVNPFPDDKSLDWSKLKQIADDILKCI